ncbi:Uncharacterised protein [Escherichia coli]|uniref:Uncharacterized protein n=1 Tax=Escherichia coli TaxID=562 RepID=A0A377B5U9_ECOLX|nr:Uncharacterised protein [Escherichia coli]
MFINAITEGVSDFPVMIFSIAAIKVIYAYKIMWLKCIGELIGDFKIPVGTNFIVSLLSSSPLKSVEL